MKTMRSLMWLAALSCTAWFSAAEGFGAERTNEYDRREFARTRSPVYEIADPNGVHARAAAEGKPSDGKSNDYGLLDAVSDYGADAISNLLQKVAKPFKATENIATAIQEGDPGATPPAPGVAPAPTAPVPGRATGLRGLREWWKNLPPAEKVGWSAEAVDALCKLVDVGITAQEVGGKEAASKFVQELTKFVGGNFAGGKIGALVVIGMAGAPGWAIWTAAVGTAWGATALVEWGIDKTWTRVGALSRFYGTSTAGKLDPDLIRWLGIRTKDGFIIDICEEDESLHQVIPAGLGADEFTRILNTAQQNCLDRGRELLEGLPSPFPPGSMRQGENASLDELADLIPWDVKDDAELKKLVVKLAWDAVRKRNLGHMTGETDEEAQVREYFRRAYPFIKRALLRRMKYWEDRARQLCKEISRTGLTLSFAPDIQVQIDPATGKAEVTVTVEDGNLNATLTRLRWILRRTHGDVNSIHVEYLWKGPDGKVRRRAAPEGRSEKFEMTAPKGYEIRVQRVITVGAEGPRIIQSTVDMVIVEVAKYPGDIAGRWIDGKFVIRETPLLDKMPANAPASSTADKNNPLAELGQGCADAGMAIQVLKKLVGVPMPMWFSVKPDPDPTTGTLTTHITPPQQLSPQGEQAQSVPYRYAKGVLTVEATKDKATMKMRGTFAPNDKNWTIQGTWQLFLEQQGQSVLFMSGTWSGMGPQAAPGAKPAPKPPPKPQSPPV